MRLPLKDIYITQYFGQNLANFYQQWGLKGHNGVDFRARNGCSLYAAMGGTVTSAGKDADGGIQIKIWNKPNRLMTIYYHLKEVYVKAGDDVKAGANIGACDNTGKYTTGDHLHFGLKQTDEFGMTINKDNGYDGAIDPAPYFTQAYNGFPIGNKDWDKSRGYHRYYREAKRNLANEMKTALYMARRLKRLPTNEEINACVWGYWDIETVMNEGMWEIWGQLKKDEWQRGIKSFT
jgi:murein DD-endopeptidase MepM/ murein hydrolase activator NlpD